MKCSAGLLTLKCFIRWLHSIVEALTWLLAWHWHPALCYYACDCHDILPSWGHHRFDTVQVMGPCVYRKSHAVIHWAHRIWNDQSCCGCVIITAFCASYCACFLYCFLCQIAFQVIPLTAGTTSKTLYGIMEGTTFHSWGVAFASKDFSFPSRYTPICIYSFSPPLNIVIGIYKLDEILVCTQGRVIVLA